MQHAAQAAPSATPGQRIGEAVIVEIPPKGDGKKVGGNRRRSKNLREPTGWFLRAKMSAFASFSELVFALMRDEGSKQGPHHIAIPGLQRKRLNRGGALPISSCLRRASRWWRISGNSRGNSFEAPMGPLWSPTRLRVCATSDNEAASPNVASLLVHRAPPLGRKEPHKL